MDEARVVLAGEPENPEYARSLRLIASRTQVVIVLICVMTVVHIVTVTILSLLLMRVSDPNRVAVEDIRSDVAEVKATALAQNHMLAALYKAQQDTNETLSSVLAELASIERIEVQHGGSSEKGSDSHKRP